MQGLLAPGYLLRACILINLITFVIYGCDKLFASSGLWRIPEITLLLFAFIGGAYGAGLGMLLFRHKIRKTAFTVFVPLFAILWTGIIVYFTIFKGA